MNRSTISFYDVRPGKIIVSFLEFGAVYMCMVRTVSEDEIKGHRMFTSGDFVLDRKHRVLSWSLGEIDIPNARVLVPNFPPSIDLTLRAYDQRLLSGGNPRLSKGEIAAMCYLDPKNDGSYLRYD